MRTKFILFLFLLFGNFLLIGQVNNGSKAGGSESFDNSTAVIDYGDGSFVGDNGITWNYTRSRDQGDFPINDNGLMLQRASDSKLESGIITGGIASFEVKMRKAFTGARERKLELYVNDVLIGTSQGFGSGTGVDANIYTFTVNDINVPGDIVIKLKPEGTQTNNQQIVVDDIVWTGYESNEPHISISSPVNNSTIYTSDVDIVFNVVNFDIGGTNGKVKYTIDGGIPQYVTASPIALTGLTQGSHTVVVELVNNDNSSLNPAVSAQVTFNVDLTEPETTSVRDIQYTTDPSGNSPYMNQTLTTRGIVSAVWGNRFWIQDGAGAWNGLYIFSSSSPTPALGDDVRVNGTIIEYYNLTEMDPVNSVVILSSGNNVPEPTVLSTADAGQEMYESVLIRVTGTCMSVPDQNGVWSINDGSGVVYVDDIMYDFEPVVGNVYTLTGILYYSFEQWRILPRNAADVVEGGEGNPYITITSPANGQFISTQDVQVSFNITNFELGTDGRIAYSLDGGAVNYHSTTSAINLQGLSYASHTVSLELVDMNGNSLDPQARAEVTFTVYSPSSAGMETFDNSTATDSYGDGSFTGNNNIEWTFTHSRSEGDYAINDKGLMLRTSGSSKLVSGPISGGISNFQVSMKKAFTGGSERQIELYINGVLKGTSQGFGEGSGVDENVYTFSVNNINVPGEFTMMIKGVGNDEINKQVVIDDIIWTSFDSSDPYLAITSPVNNSTIYNDFVNIQFTVLNFEIGEGAGQIRYIVDGGAPQFTRSTGPIGLLNLSQGNHSVTLELMTNEGLALNPAVTSTVSFRYDIPEITRIYDIQYTENPDGLSEMVNQTVWVRGVITANFNGTQYGRGFYVQDGGGPWESIYIFSDNALRADGYTEGVTVNVRGTVTEYNGFTQIQNVNYIEIYDPNITQLVPISVTTGDANAEMYESCFIKVENAQCLTGLNLGIWTVNDGTGILNCKRIDGNDNVTPVVGRHYDVAGVLDFRGNTEGGGVYNLQYRNAYDVNITGINTEYTDMIRIYPNPAVDYLQIELPESADNIAVINILGQTVKEVNNISETHILNVDDLDSGVYFVRITKNNDIAVLKFVVQ